MIYTLYFIKNVHASVYNSNNDILFARENLGIICNYIFDKKPLENNWKKIKGVKLHLQNGSYEILIKSFKRQQKTKLITMTFKKEKPYLQIRLNNICEIKNIRFIEYNKKMIPNKIFTLDYDFKRVLKKKELNPDLKFNLNTKSKIDSNYLIALVDTGINYNLKDLRENIAIRNNKILGYDFWDDDNLPFDNDPRSNPFYPMHHGTTIFSVLSNESKQSKISVYRFPANNLCKFSNLIDHIVKHSIRVVNLSMGSSDKTDWLCFYETAKKSKNVIFVVSAGNNNKNIDIKPIYPASFKLENIITVSSSNQSGKLGRMSNYGKESVDFFVPAERIKVIDHRGIKSITGGTSYAAPRITALISRYLISNNNSSVKRIIEFLKKRSIPMTEKLSKYGWIPDPTDNYLIN